VNAFLYPDSSLSGLDSVIGVEIVTRRQSGSAENR
jgi:hypothetical protein